MKICRITNFLFLALLISLFQLNSQNQIEFKIVVHESNPIKKISADELKMIFLKKTTKWENGEKIYPADLYETSKTREYFTEEIHGKRVAAIKAYWQKQIFTGRGVPPPEKSSEKELLEYIEKNDGGIGYIAKGRSINNYKVKVIEIVD